MVEALDSSAPLRCAQNDMMGVADVGIMNRITKYY